MSRAETTLYASWSKRERDLSFHWPAQKPDGHLLYGALCAKQWGPDGEMRPSLVEELESRGYDITTLRFSVKAKPSAPFMLRRFREKSRAWFGRAHG